MVCCWSANSKQSFETKLPKEDMVDMVVKVTIVGTVKIVENVVAVATVIVLLKNVKRVVAIQ